MVTTARSTIDRCLTEELRGVDAEQAAHAGSQGSQRDDLRGELVLCLFSVDGYSDDDLAPVAERGDGRVVALIASRAERARASDSCAGNRRRDSRR